MVDPLELEEEEGVELVSVVTDLNQRMFDQNKTLNGNVKQLTNMVRQLQDELARALSRIDDLNKRMNDVALYKNSAGSNPFQGMKRSAEGFNQGGKRHKNDGLMPEPDLEVALDLEDLDTTRPGFRYGQSAKPTTEMVEEMRELLDQRGVDESCIQYYEKNHWALGHFLPLLRDSGVPKSKHNESGYWVSTLRHYVESGGHQDYVVHQVKQCMLERGVDVDCQRFFDTYAHEPKIREKLAEMLLQIENPKVPADQSRQSAYWTSVFRKILQSEGVLTGPPKKRN